MNVQGESGAGWRWWIYQRERFPLAQHAPLILAFSACAVSYSALLTGAGVPPWQAYGVAFGICLGFFLQLRIADEFKDAGEDARWRPYRPVPRGLIKLGELRRVFIAAAVIQLGLALAWEPRLLWVLGIGWTYLALMSVEFFARDWLKARPVVYLLSHMGIMPLVDLVATACEWMPIDEGVPTGLGPFLAASFCNGLVIELGRKLRQPEDEEDGVETYSRLWGRRGGAATWLACMAVTAALALVAGHRIGFMLPLAVVLGVVGVIAVVMAVRYMAGRLHGKRIELVAGVWTLVLYLTLGVVPLVMERGYSDSRQASDFARPLQGGGCDSGGIEDRSRGLSVATPPMMASRQGRIPEGCQQAPSDGNRAGIPPGCGSFSPGCPGVSLCSTPGYGLPSLRLGLEVTSSRFLATSLVRARPRLQGDRQPLGDGGPGRNVAASELPSIDLE